MSFLSFLLGEKKQTASVAKERLQIILAHERSGRNAAGHDEQHAGPAHQGNLVAEQKQPIQSGKHNARILQVGHHQGRASAVGLGHAQLPQRRQHPNGQ